MKITNAKYITEDKSIIDVIINHSEFGEIPYTFNSLEDDKSIDSEIREYLKTANIEAFIPPSQKEQNIVFNDGINLQISELENSLSRPLRELLSSTTNDFDRAYAQNKVDTVERQIQTLRNELINEISTN